jgi:hypothetical protein
MIRGVILYEEGKKLNTVPSVLSQSLRLVIQISVAVRELYIRFRSLHCALLKLTSLFRVLFVQKYGSVLKESASCCRHSWFRNAFGSFHPLCSIEKPVGKNVFTPPPAVFRVLTVRIGQIKFANLKIGNGACIRASPEKGVVASKLGRSKWFQAAVSTWACLRCLPAAVH